MTLEVDSQLTGVVKSLNNSPREIRAFTAEVWETAKGGDHLPEKPIEEALVAKVKGLYPKWY